MRFLHTSDWHLGRAFHGVSLLAAQADFLDHLVEVVRAERVDAVLVPGDVYDRALPSPDTVALLSDGLARLVDAGAQVVLTSGNHDSATRLGFGSALLERAGVHVRTGVGDIGRPVRIGDAVVHTLPYLEPRLTAEALGGCASSHAGVLAAAMDRVRAAGPVTVVLAHAFVSGGAASESERDITVGGVNTVPATVFDGVAYAALGHLHGAQEVAPGVRYSGSPLAFSFGEAAHRKGSLLVDVGPAGLRSVERVEAPVPRPLAVLRGRLEDLLADPRHAAAEQAWCQVVVTDPVRPLGAMERLRRRFPHTLDLRLEPEGGELVRQTYAARVGVRTLLEVCTDFVGHVRGGAQASDTERALLAEAVEGARLTGAARDDEGVARPAVEPAATAGAA